MSRWKHVKRGWRKIGRKTIYFDSMAEANYYRYLCHLRRKKKIKQFVYHPPYFDFSDWIKHGTNRYEIDFKIIYNDGSEQYIEVKSTNDLTKMDSRSRTRIKRLLKYYPDTPFKIVTTLEIKALGARLSIKGWE